MKKMALAMLALISVAAYAGPILGSGTFSAFGSNPNNNSKPFWDHASSDNSPCNIGYFLAGGFGNCNSMKLGTPAAGLGLGKSNLEYYSNSGKVTAFTLAAGTYDFRLEGSIAGSNDHVFGYFATGGGAAVTIFDSHKNVAANTFTLTVLEEVALYMKSDGYTFRSNDTSGMGAAALRTTSGTYFFGFEDRPSGDSDYNDMMISATYSQNQVQTPEPASIALIGVGLLALGAVRFAKR